ncbi:MAG: cytidylate kinase-like family protein [Chloroflexi bacterium HGW-Chloroflexi-5]|nr:MAG: cytidylate kinase-like family protein [Deltaproteobacteria bacterium HGW-Deltaproteobacteria-12]PKN96444.1 MAG: cytidylate kinase-like family protein [Chloroflexi bacterium HGW-Chloroflexi-5]
MENVRSQEARMEQYISAQLKKWQLNKKKKYKNPLRPVITISRLPGSGANALAKQLSEDLNIDLFDNEIVGAVAQSAQVGNSVIAALDEQDRSILDDWIGTFEKKHHLWSDEYLLHLTKVVGAIAAHGHAIIVGRGAGYILPGKVCLRLLIVAPMDVRISNVKHAYGVTDKEAERRIIKTEKDRKAFIKKYFNADLTDPSNYDLTLNTTHYTTEAAAKIIKEAFNSRPWYDYSIQKL